MFEELLGLFILSSFNRKACQQNFLSVARMHEWQEIYRQLRQLVIGRKMKINSKRDHAAIHRALLSGLLSGVAHRTSDNEYTGAGGVKFHLWPGSGLCLFARGNFICGILLSAFRQK